MKLSFILLIVMAARCGALELQAVDAASLKAAWNGPAIPVSAPLRVEERSRRACEGYPLTMRLKSRTVTLPAAGVWTRESHLATTGDSFGRRAFPGGVKENISAHLAASLTLLAGQVRGASYGSVYPYRWDREWTPAEGGRVGQGSVSKKPSPEEEMWVFNMMWMGKSMPKPGTKFLATYNGRSVVVVGGYERGPSSKRFLGGFQPEVLWYLGAAEGSGKVTLSALKNQGLKPGPIDCR